jgi:hypothetical protein
MKSGSVPVTVHGRDAVRGQPTVTETTMTRSDLEAELVQAAGLFAGSAAAEEA